MKKLSIIMAVLACFGLALGACGDDDDKNVCEQAADVVLGGMDSFCSGQDDDCVSCKCNNLDQMVDVVADATCKEPPAPGDPVACEGAALTAAQACLDLATCGSDAGDGMKMGCQAEHLADECTEDADCLYDMTCNADTSLCSMPI